MHTFLVKKQLYNPTEGEHSLKVKQLFNCLHALGYFLPALVDIEDDGCGCVSSVNRRAGLFVMLRGVDNDTKPG